MPWQRDGCASGSPSLGSSGPGPGTIQGRGRGHPQLPGQGARMPKAGLALGPSAGSPGVLGKREVKQPLSEDGKRVGDPSPPRGLCEVHATSPLQVSPDPGWVNSPLLLELRPGRLCHLTPSLAEGQMDGRPSCAPLGRLPTCQVSPRCPCWGSASGLMCPHPSAAVPRSPLPSARHGSGGPQGALKALLSLSGCFFPLPNPADVTGEGRKARERRPRAKSGEQRGWLGPRRARCEKQTHVPPSAGFKNKKRRKKPPLIFPHQFNRASFQVPSTATSIL